ncbi:HAD-IA family hydrolase [Sphingomonas sp. SUN019]|uniref:HAD-IA family hydrolase n=1 Tax=Sphingomonas sp. SUN019 TaxID=2937788 RepID=UPI0021640274|nr:HAD-IA family hydrolase [Sphingomonas sp. SUN019]UVO49865.1 HAD-IA family hydrolase [Sphingomonas sp. SUN019]
MQAIIFDVDGTLAETEETHRAAFNLAFAEAGYAWCWSPDDYTALLTTTGGRERIGRHMTEIGVSPDPAVIAALHVRKNQLYADLIASGAVAPRPGVRELIAEARRDGIATAIATTTSRSNLIALLDRIFGPKAMHGFAAVICGEDVAAKKPDPEVYRRALAALGLRAPACVAIEDSANGLAAARACGIATVVTLSRYTIGEHFDGAALVRESLADDNGRVGIAELRALLTQMAAAV